MSAGTRRLSAMAIAAFSVAAQFLAPAAEAAPPPQGPVITPCQVCGIGGPRLDIRPDLYLATLYQRDASGNAITSATAGQTVVYPMTVGNQGLLATAQNVSVWWMGDTSGLSSQGWQFVSFTADSGFSCHQPGDDYTGEQVRCDGGTIAAGQVAHITFTMRAPTTSGVHHIGASIDPLNAITERDETNNNPCCLSLTI